MSENEFRYSFGEDFQCLEPMECAAGKAAGDDAVAVGDEGSEVMQLEDFAELLPNAPALYVSTPLRWKSSDRYCHSILN